MSSIVDISEVLLECGLSGSVTDEERAIANQAIIKAEGAIKRFLHYDPIYKTHTEFYPQQDMSSRSGEGSWDVTDTQAVYREVSQEAGNELQLLNIPVRSITELYIDYGAKSGTASGSFAAASLKTEGTDFWPNYDLVDSDSVSVCSDGIIRSFGAWPSEPGTVKVVYVAGYKEAEFHGQDSSIDVTPIWEAALNEACARVRKMMLLKKKDGSGFTAGAIKSEKLGDYSYSTDCSTLDIAIGGSSMVSGESAELLTPYIMRSFVF